MRKTQKDIVFDLVKELQPVRTEIIKIEAMRKGVSCADRHLRWLAEENKIKGNREKGDATKTWTLCAITKFYSDLAKIEPEQTFIADDFAPDKQLSMDFINNNPVNI